MKTESPWLDVVLTEEELQDAITAKKKEVYYREIDRASYRAETQRIEFMKGDWNHHDMMRFVSFKAETKFGFSRNNGVDGRPVLNVDKYNSTLFEALCYYFVSSPLFEKIMIRDEDGTGCIDPNWRLNKGLLLCGSVGVGKTKIMQLFSVNKRQNFEVLNALDISNLFASKSENGGVEVISRFSKMHKPLQVKHEDNLWQERTGLCIDDLGTEEDKINFGNKSNVIADILFGRYSNSSLARDMTHVTTNLTVKGIKERYGERIWSRMSEMFNVIQMEGGDRREGARPQVIQPEL